MRYPLETAKSLMGFGWVAHACDDVAGSSDR